MRIVRSMMRSRPLVVMWTTALVPRPAPLCVPPVPVLRLTLSSATPAPAPVDRPMDTG